MRTEFVRRKLGLIAEDLEQLAHFRDVSLESLTAEPLRLAAVERLLERIVMRAIDVNEHLIASASSGRESRITRFTYRETFLRLEELGVCSADLAERLAASAGLRNILVHDYNDVDHRILHGAITSCLTDYRQYIERVLAYLDATSPPE